MIEDKMYLDKRRGPPHMRYRALRKTIGNQGDVGKALGLSHATMSNRENGHTETMREEYFYALIGLKAFVKAESQAIIRAKSKLPKP